MSRSLMAAFAGTLSAIIIIMFVEMLGHQAYPLPKGIDINDTVAMQKHIDNLPMTAFLIVLAGWGLGTFTGTWLAVRIAGKDNGRPALLVGLILLIAGITNMIMLPHPGWFWFLGIAVFPLATVFGMRTAAQMG